MHLRLVVTAILLSLVLVFAVQNSTTVEIKLLFWQVSLPRSLLIFTMLFVGIIVGWILRAMIRITRRPD